MKHYRLNELAMISGLTTRTLRNYLNQGILKGEKVNGVWCFTEEEVMAFMDHPLVKQAAAIHRNGVIHDFLADTYKKENRICMVIDCPVGPEEAAAIADFFCKAVCEIGEDIDFRYVHERNMARMILSGAEDQVLDIIRRYYQI